MDRAMFYAGWIAIICGVGVTVLTLAIHRVVVSDELKEHVLLPLWALLCTLIDYWYYTILFLFVTVLVFFWLII